MKKIISLLFALLAVCACDQRDMIAKMTPPAAHEFADRFFAAVRQGDMETLTRMTVAMEAQGMTPEMREAGLRKLIAQFPKATPESSEVVGVHTNWNGAFENIGMVIEYRIGKPSFLAEIMLQKSPDPLDSEFLYQVIGTGGRVIPVSYAELNAFRLSGKPFSSYLVMASNALVLAFMAVSFLAALRARGWRYKWLWCCLTIIGLGAAKVDWTTGVITTQLLYVGIFPVGIGRDGYSGPWHFGVTLPVGAMIFWWRWFKRRPGPRVEDVF